MFEKKPWQKLLHLHQGWPSSWNWPAGCGQPERLTFSESAASQLWLWLSLTPSAWTVADLGTLGTQGFFNFLVENQEETMGTLRFCRKMSRKQSNTCFLVCCRQSFKQLQGNQSQIDPNPEAWWTTVQHHSRYDPGGSCWWNFGHHGTWHRTGFHLFISYKRFQN